jgi:probable HAF family extracellular repeat protein
VSVQNVLLAVNQLLAFCDYQRLKRAERKDHDMRLQSGYFFITLSLMFGGVSYGPLVGFSGVAVAQTPRYKILDLGPFMAREIDERPGLNSNEKIASWKVINQTHTTAAILDGQSSKLIEGTSDSNSFALGIDYQDKVVGILESRADLRRTQAFLYRNGSLETLPTLGGRFAAAKSIGKGGLIVGNAETRDRHVHATVWSGEKASDLGTLPGGDFSRAFEVNDTGDIAGEANAEPNGKTHAVLWESGRIHDLGLLSGGSFSSAQAVNGKHQAVGFADGDDGGSKAVLFSNGKVIDLGSFGDEPSSALSINDAGQIVGSSPIAEGKMRAFLWERGRLLNLNELIPKNAGWLLMAAYRINRNGAILAQGFHGGATHLCLLVPATAIKD